MKTDLSHIRTARVLFDALRAEVEAELAELEKGRLNQHEQARRSHLRQTRAQIDNGLHPSDGTDPRLWALITREEVTRLRLKRPGLAALARVENQLLTEALAASEPRPRAGTYRVRDGRRFILADRDVRGGELVELTDAQAVAFADSFDPV